MVQIGATMPLRFRQLVFVFVTVFATADVCAHPVSHTDAWITIDEDLEVRLNIFLHDVLGLDSDQEAAAGKVSADSVSTAVAQHAQRLPDMLKIYVNGRRLVLEIAAVPQWKPRGESVDLVANSGLRISWKLRADLSQLDLRTLTVVHGFEGADSDKPGELRLQLRRPAARRISAVIAANRPYTILLSPSAEGDMGRQVNQAQSRIIVTQASLIHEFTAPLSRLSPELIGQHAVDFTSVDTVSSSLREWFAVKVGVAQGGRGQLRLEDTVVRFFKEGLADDDESRLVDTSTERVPLMGTTVGVRQTFRWPENSAECVLRFMGSPGDFDELSVSVVTAAGETSSMSSFGEASAVGNDGRPALSFEIDTENATADRPILTPDSVVPKNLVRTVWSRSSPGLLAAGGLLIGCIIASVARRFVLALLLVIAGPTVVHFTTVTSHIVDGEATHDVLSHVLASVYDAANSRSRSSALEVLGGLLEDDLLESTFLEMTDLVNSDEDGVLVNVDRVELDDIDSLNATSESALALSAKWHVTGTVYHWGHVHDRIHQCAARVELSKTKGGEWKIRRLHLDDVTIDSGQSNS